MSAIWLIVGVIIGLAIQYVAKWLPVFKKKWIKGECRHICVFCEYYDENCKYELGVDKEYNKGFDEGYLVGYNDANNRL